MKLKKENKERFKKLIIKFIKNKRQKIPNL